MASFLTYSICILSSSRDTWDALHLFHIILFLSTVSVYVLLTSVIFVLRLTCMLLLAAVAPKTKTKFYGKA